MDQKESSESTIIKAAAVFIIFYLRVKMTP